jgi:ribosome-associated protein
VQSIAENVETALRKEATIVGTEGAREGQWALIDLGGVVVHVFHQFARQEYDLEALYTKAPRTRVSEAPAQRPARHLLS